MPTRPRRISRPSLARLFVVAVVAMSIAGCGRAMTSSGRSVSGFPFGSYAKELQDPEFGRIRLVWTFDDGGQFAEVPFALDGQTLHVPPTRGTYAIEGQAMTISIAWPPEWGTSQHGWRLDGDRLWTVFLSSSNPEDQQWFEMLDTRPWVPVG